MKFALVADYFKQIEQESSRTAITMILADLFKSATAREISILCNLSLGQLHPPYVGTQFVLAEKSMRAILARLLNLSLDTVKDLMQQEGDLADLCTAYTWQPTGACTVLEVYQALSALESMSGTGSQEARADALVALLSALDPLSAKYVVRIVLGKLRLGFSDMTIIDALSWVLVGDKSLRSIIEDAYNICVDIGRIASLVRDGGIEAVKAQVIQVGIPIRPAAAERLPTAQAIVDKLGTCSAQPKLDGFRLQIHVDKQDKQPRVHFFSRNLIDMSAMFPDLVAAFCALDVTTLICEGEAIGYDPNTGSFLPFQETVKRKRKHDIDVAAQELPLQLFLFDLLYVDGVSYLDKTHQERRTKLKKIVASAVQTDSPLAVIEEAVISSAAQLSTYFSQHVAAGLEGLVVKRPDALYTPGKRNFNWIKLKREEEGHLEDTIDCVLLGYYAGKGKRAAFGIGAFLVGVYNKHEDLFQTVAKIGTGLTDEEWRTLKQMCDSLKVAHAPSDVVCAKELAPDVWVTPTIVCMIRADEITLSPVHTAGKTDIQLGYALRFPRFMGYRPDKSVREITQVGEIIRLYENQFAKKAVRPLFNQ